LEINKIIKGKNNIFYQKKKSKWIKLPSKSTRRRNSWQMVSSTLSSIRSSPRLSKMLVTLVLKSEEPLSRLKSESSQLSPNRLLVLRERNTRNSLNSSRRDSDTLMIKSRFSLTPSSTRVSALPLKLKP